MGPRSRWRIRMAQGASLAAVVAVWAAVVNARLFPGDIVPSPAAVAGRIVGLALSADFYGHLRVTAAEIAGGLALAAVAGILLGVAIGARPLLRRAYEPWLHYLAPTPKIVFFPVMLMLFGVGAASKVSLATLGAFFPIVLGTISGVREMDPVLVQVGRGFALSPYRMLTMVYVPAIRAALVNAVRLGFGVAVVVVLLAETKLSSAGIGYLIIDAYRHFDMPLLAALVLVLFGLAILANAGLARLARHGAPAVSR
ncbi:ABC transporter permease [Rhodoplanes roseus]|uniref:ABC transmembrane type-1 domain-containing protein n=1 Tax=Rhodoplanes roseus TaxID=29409 RepID=A0A327L8X0_9BRAD|nr:ABC transporter permease subunit [Rhodoplanes roseus]RAI44138.1 hypothetical protein CH341_10630 [Rhodoplanes roseus]